MQTIWCSLADQIRGALWRDPVWLEANLARHGGAIPGAAPRLAAELGVDPTTITKWIRKHKAASLIHREPSPVTLVRDVIRLEGDVAPSSDWHLPLTRYDLFENWLEAAYDAGIKTGVCAGDMVNLDYWSDHYPKQEGCSVEVEQEHAAYAVSMALDVFDELVICLGNHDERAVKKVGYSTSFDNAMRSLLHKLPSDKQKRIRITSRDYVIVDTEEGEWRICHTKSYSKQPLAYPIKLALRHNQHIAAGHRHHLAQGYAPNGKMVVELGGFYDASVTEYLDRYTNDFPEWQPGWWLLQDGRMNCPMLYTKGKV